MPPRLVEEMSAEELAGYQEWLEKYEKDKREKDKREGERRVTGWWTKRGW